jgi:hypothetical protein
LGNGAIIFDVSWRETVNKRYQMIEDDRDKVVDDRYKIME